MQDFLGGHYVVSRIVVSTAENSKIGAAVDLLYSQWQPSSGWTVDDKPALEIYYDSPGHKPGTWITMDFCIPVKPL